MANSSCGPVSTDALLALGIPDTDSASQYACATASRYSRFAACCGGAGAVHAFAADSCYSWCDLPASLNARFDASTGLDDDAYSYVMDCLEEGGAEVDALHCRAKPHVISISTNAPSPTSTFNQASFCASQWPPAQTELGGLLDPNPGCAVLPNATNEHVLQRCCDPAPVEYSVEQCYVYCALPRGTGFRGEGGLSTDQALGSFRACLFQFASGLDNETLFGGMYCRANESAVALNSSDFGTTQYLTGGGIGVRVGALWAVLLLGVALAWMLP